MSILEPANGGRHGRTITSSSGRRLHYPPVISGQYRLFTAQRLAAGRRARPGRGKLVRDAVLRQFVADRLEKRWSSEQISHALRAEFPDDPDRQVVPETIYQAIYRPELGGLRRDLPRCCGPGGPGASHAAARMRVAPVPWWT